MTTRCSWQLAAALAALALAALGGAAASSPSPGEELWNAALSRNVHPRKELQGVSLSRVDWQGMYSAPELDQFLSIAKATRTAQFDRNQTYAFYINVYNAFAVKMVLNNPCRMDAFGYCGPIASIRDIGKSYPSLGAPVWSMPAGFVNGKTYSLDDVEDYLRNPVPFKEDPRLHAAIVCASISCPNLRNESYRAERIDEQLTDQMRDFLSNPDKGMHLNRDTMVLTLSEIFEWFASDFSSHSGSVVDFILPYIPDESDRAFVAANKGSLSLAYFDYNWDLNGDLGGLCASSARPCCPGWALLVLAGGILLVSAVLCIVFYRKLKKQKEHTLLYTPSD